MRLTIAVEKSDPIRTDSVRCVLRTYRLLADNLDQLNKIAARII